MAGQRKKQRSLLQRQRDKLKAQRANQRKGLKRPALPPSGGSSASKPSGVKQPKDGRPKDRRTLAKQKQEKAKQGTKSTKVRTPTSNRDFGYKDDLKQGRQQLQRLGRAIGSIRTPAQAAGAYLAGKIWESRGRDGAANMSLLGGDAPTKKKKKK